jgi:hypothetical protein
MHSEIPQLEVITAISDAETEDFVAQLLYSQGWSIIFRAIDTNSLKQAILERGVELRTIVIYISDFPGLDDQTLGTLIGPSTSLICIDDVEITSHSLMTNIRGQLRLPLIHALPSIRKGVSTENELPQVQAAKVVTVTGTTGAPGRSHLAFNLASHLSWQSAVQLVDADLRSPSLAYLFGSAATVGNRCQLLTLDSEKKPIELPRFQDHGKELSVVDIGALPPIEEVINDRRWQATLINHILESTSSLIYVTKSSGLGLLRLEGFMTEFPILLRKIPIIYVLNQNNATREARAVAARFNSLTNGEKRFVLPQDLRPLTPPKSKRNGIEFLKASSRLGKEIGKIADVVR